MFGCGLVSKKNKQFVLDASGKAIYQFTEDSDIKNHRWIISQKGSKTEIFHLPTKNKIALKKYEIQYFGNNLLILEQDDRIGVMNAQGEWIIEPDQQSIRFTQDDYFLISKGKERSFHQPDGSVSTMFNGRFDKVIGDTWYFTDTLYKEMHFNYKGEEMHAFQKSKPRIPFKKGYSITSKGRKCYFIDEDGEELKTSEFRSIQRTPDGYYICRNKAGFYLYDQNITHIIGPIPYRPEKWFENKWVLTQIESVRSLLNDKRKVISSGYYDDFHKVGFSIYMVVKGDKVGYLDSGTGYFWHPEKQ